MRRVILPALFLFALGVGPAAAGTFVVTNTDDAGFGSLRNAIVLANANLGPDEIEFAVPPGSVVQLLTPLPTITNAVAIGVTRMADLRIFGGHLPPGSRGLHVTGHDVYIEGVVLYAFLDDASQEGGEGIVFEGGSDGAVVSCTIFNVSGPAIRIVDSSFNYLGSNILGGSEVGVLIEGSSNSNTLYGNSIGAGPGVSGNLGHGVVILSGEDNLLGNRGGVCTICVSNAISFNNGSGVFIGSAAVGTRLDSFNEVSSNGGNGVEIQGGEQSRIGGRISRNGAAGVFVASGDGNTIRAGISDHDNGLGIDLAPEGVTANDPGDADTGPNGLQNFPILSSVVTSPGAVVTLTGILQSASNAPYVIDFYASETCDDSGNGEGAFYFGSANVVSDAAGQAVINVTFGPGLVLQGPAVTATATDAAGNTSEFSPCALAVLPVVAQIEPDSGPDTGGDAVEISGANFQDGATVSIGGIDTTAVFESAGEIDTFSPMLPPGTLNDVVVTNPDGQMGVLEDGWFSNFLDVQEDHLFHDFVEAIFRAKVTAGCGSGNYCVDAPVRRDQMAVFLLRSSRGPTYVPDPATGIYFLDVPADAFAAAWIEALYNAEITAGCDVALFCPADPVTRAQMAVFLLRTLMGSTYDPPAASGTVFLDVPANAFAADWIEELAERGITAGCAPNLFCPDASTTRGQMAVFLTVTFGL